MIMIGRAIGVSWESDRKSVKQQLLFKAYNLEKVQKSTDDSKLEKFQSWKTQDSKI